LLNPSEMARGRGRNLVQPSIPPEEYTHQYMQAMAQFFPPFSPMTSGYPDGNNMGIPYQPMQQSMPMPFYPTPPLPQPQEFLPPLPQDPPRKVSNKAVSFRSHGPRPDIYVHPLWTDVIPPSGIPGHPSLLEEGTVTIRPRGKAITIRRPGQSQTPNTQKSEDQQTGKWADGTTGNFKASLQDSGLSKFVSWIASR
jgi:hypothetical protein